MKKLDSPEENPAIHSGCILFNKLRGEGFRASIFMVLASIKGKCSFKIVDKPQLRDALYSKISFSPSILVCLFSNINNTICLKICKSLYLLVNNKYFSK